MRKSIIAFFVLASFAAVLALWALPSENEARKRIVDTAQSFKGVPYVYGAESPEAFDCSGFVQYVYAHAADIALPRNSKGQWAAGKPVEKSAAKAGDIFVFDTVGGGGPSHVAIFLGGDSMIHAISEGPKTGVVVSPITDRYFGPRLIGARYFIVSVVPSESTAAAVPAQAAVKPAAEVKPAAPAAIPAQETAKPAAPAVKPVAEVKPAAPSAVPAQAAVKPAAEVKPAAPSAPVAVVNDEPPVSQVGFVLKPTPEVFTDKIPAATGTAIAFTITNGTGKNEVFHVFFYKADVDFRKTKILREDRQMIQAGGSVEIEPYLFTEPGIYRLNVKTADNTQLMQRTWKVVDIKG
jgi:hypothetical protein